jgi:hypothetical protein
MRDALCSGGPYRDGTIRRRALGYACVAVLLAGLSAPNRADATAFAVTFDPSTAAAPPGFFTALTSALQVYQSLYVDPITINLHVGWGDINNAPMSPGFIGQSLTNQQAFPYATVRTALTNDAKTSDDAVAVASLPGSDPTPGRNFAMSNAEAKALGLLAGNAVGIDGWVGFNRNVVYTFDPNNRAVAGAYDFIGVAEHEITEVMGRYGFGQNGGGGRDSPIDLFRYFSPGVRDLSPAFGGGANYFSINGGVTSINTFNTVCCGDLSDWAGQSLDSYNAFLTLGQRLPTSAGDLVVMDVIGYDRAPAEVPEPATLTLLGLGMIRTLASRRFKTGSSS